MSLQNLESVTLMVSKKRCLDMTGRQTWLNRPCFQFLREIGLNNEFITTNCDIKAEIRKGTTLKQVFTVDSLTLGYAELISLPWTNGFDEFPQNG